MEKMGYIVGAGLGKNSQGRVNPVTAVILPAGKSLGVFINLLNRLYASQKVISNQILQSWM